MSPGVSSTGRAWARSRISPINETMGPIHDRLPVILPPAAWDAWLDPTNDDTEALAKLLVPAPADLLVARPVSTAVNSTRNNGPDLVAEATPDQLVG